jgi:molybdenum cofactor cytidylyltransferase
MKFGPLPLNQAEGKILGHNIAGLDGRRLLRKGKALTHDQLEVLRSLGRQIIYVAELEAGDVDENTAARRVAQAAAGEGLHLSGPASGRVNLLASVPGVLRVDAERLTRLNACEDITLATLAAQTPVRARQIVATVKVIPYAVSDTVLRAAAVIASEDRPILRLSTLAPQNIGLIYSSSPATRVKLAADFAPLQERIAALGSRIIETEHIPLEDESGEEALSQILIHQCAAGVRLIVLAGETAIMDRRDIVPRAVERAGGRVECVGAPVDPGNLLMLAYLGDVPILGAPGCARSRKVNIVDWVLPRLLVGDRLTRADIVSLGHGGLLEDVPERPMPRNDLV